MQTATSFRKSNRNQSGFSLIELLIVVAIILIIAAIAVPSLLRARVSANEASASQSVRQIGNAQASYIGTYGGYAANLAALGTGTGNTACPLSGPTATSACILDGIMSAGAKTGYTLTSVGASPDANANNQTFLTNAVPTVKGTTGNRTFCGTEDNNVKQVPGGGTVDYPGCQAADPVVK